MGQDELEFYRDAAGEVRWRYKAVGNNEVIADGAEGYASLAQAMESAYRVTNIQDHQRHALLASATHSIAASRPDGSTVLVVLNGV